MIEAVPERRLCNLDDDPGETTDVAAEHPEVVEQLVERIRQARQRLGDMDCVGSGARFFDEGRRSPLIVDRRTSGWAHLTFDDFSAQGRLAPETQRQATEAIIEQE